MPVITLPCACICPALMRTTSPDALRAHGCCVSSKRLTCVRSHAVRKRNQVAKGMRHTMSTGTLPRSKTMTLKPPPCRSRSAVRNAWSRASHGRLAGGFVARNGARVSTVQDFARCGSKYVSPRRAGTRSDETCSSRSSERNMSGRFAEPGVPMDFAALRRGLSYRPPCDCSIALIASGIPLPSVRGCGLPPPLAGSVEASVTTDTLIPCFFGSSTAGLSFFVPHRTQSSRSRFTPFADADAGSSVSATSIQAATCSARVTFATRDNAAVVRPEDSGPTSSDNIPTGKPPSNRSSSAAIPQAILSGSIRWRGESADGIRAVSVFSICLRSWAAFFKALLFALYSPNRVSSAIARCTFPGAGYAQTNERKGNFYLLQLRQKLRGLHKADSAFVFQCVANQTQIANNTRTRYELFQQSTKRVSLKLPGSLDYWMPSIMNRRRLSSRFLDVCRSVIGCSSSDCRSGILRSTA
jgi:hypothetical protein